MGQDKHGDQVVKNIPDPVTTADSAMNGNSIAATGSAARLYEVRVYNANASAQFVMVHDATSLPSNGAVPVEAYTVAAETNLSITWPNGRVMGTGIVISNSSTQQTLTVGGNDCWFSVDYDNADV
jgi:hypothetical protein